MHKPFCSLPRNLTIDMYLESILQLVTTSALAEVGSLHSRACLIAASVLMEVGIPTGDHTQNSDGGSEEVKGSFLRPVRGHFCVSYFSRLGSVRICQNGLLLYRRKYRKLWNTLANQPNKPPNCPQTTLKLPPKWFLQVLGFGSGRGLRKSHDLYKFWGLAPGGFFFEKPMIFNMFELITGLCHFSSWIRVAFFMQIHVVDASFRIVKVLFMTMLMFSLEHGLVQARFYF